MSATEILHKVTTPLRVVTTFLLMLTIFALFIVPTGLIGRLFGRDPLRRREPVGETMWEASTPTDSTPEGPFRPA